MAGHSHCQVSLCDNSQVGSLEGQATFLEGQFLLITCQVPSLEGEVRSSRGHWREWWH